MESIDCGYSYNKHVVSYWIWEGKGSLDTSDIGCVLIRVSGTTVVRGRNHLYDLTVVQFDVLHGNRQWQKFQCPF